VDTFAITLNLKQEFAARERVRKPSKPEVALSSKLKKAA
jgi:hypothetical protein